MNNNKLSLSYEKHIEEILSELPKSHKKIYDIGKIYIELRTLEETYSTLTRAFEESEYKDNLKDILPEYLNWTKENIKTKQEQIDQLIKE